MIIIKTYCIILKKKFYNLKGGSQEVKNIEIDSSIFFSSSFFLFFFTKNTCVTFAK